MDVFGVAVAAGGELMRAAAIDAAYELRVFEGGALDEIADRAGIGAGRRRLRPLLDVLRAIGALDDPPPRPVVPRDGWGRMADVIRANRALDVEGGEIELRYHRHLLVAGARAARELAAQLPSGSLVDLGGGAGAYTRAYLEAHPNARATLVDFHEVVALARIELAEFGDRVRFVASEAGVANVGDDHEHDVALLANVTHLHGIAACARLVAAAARAAKLVAIKDLRVEEDRSGPIESLLFALNMALYTGDGDVYPPSQLRAWLAAAGLVELHELAVTDGICLAGRRPE